MQEGCLAASKHFLRASLQEACDQKAQTTSWTPHSAPRFCAGLCSLFEAWLISSVNHILTGTPSEHVFLVIKSKSSWGDFLFLFAARPPPLACLPTLKGIWKSTKTLLCGRAPLSDCCCFPEKLFTETNPENYLFKHSVRCHFIRSAVIARAFFQRKLETQWLLCHKRSKKLG